LPASTAGEFDQFDQAFIPLKAPAISPPQSHAAGEDRAKLAELVAIAERLYKRAAAVVANGPT
jgi:hypothetical protein